MTQKERCRRQEVDLQRLNIVDPAAPNVLDGQQPGPKQEAAEAPEYAGVIADDPGHEPTQVAEHTRRQRLGSLSTGMAKWSPQICRAILTLGRKVLCFRFRMSRHVCSRWLVASLFSS